jgi:hypothetical protein
VNLRILKEPTEQPVSVDEVSKYCIIDGDATANIGGLIAAARIMAETANGREMAPKTYELTLDSFPGALPFGMTAMQSPAFGYFPSNSYALYAGDRPPRSGIQLLAPLTAVLSVKYKTSAGDFVTLAENTDYVVDYGKEPGYIAPASDRSWPTVDLWPSGAVRVRFTAGFGNYRGTVDVVGAACTLKTGDVISPAFEGRTITIGATDCTIDTVSSPTAFALTAAPGDATGAAFLASLPCPESIRQGIALLASQWYENRVPFEAIRFAAELPYSVTTLFSHDRLFRF